MIEYSLNIIGGEWLIIIFAALILLLGTNKFPETAKKIGKIVGEYKKAKEDMKKRYERQLFINSQEIRDLQEENFKLQQLQGVA